MSTLSHNHVMKPGDWWLQWDEDEKKCLITLFTDPKHQTQNVPKYAAGTFKRCCVHAARENCRIHMALFNLRQ